MSPVDRLADRAPARAQQRGQLAHRGGRRRLGLDLLEVELGLDRGVVLALEPYGLLLHGGEPAGRGVDQQQLLLDPDLAHSHGNPVPRWRRATRREAQRSSL